jgi:hypothetical protein
MTGQPLLPAHAGLPRPQQPPTQQSDSERPSRLASAVRLDVSRMCGNLEKRHRERLHVLHQQTLARATERQMSERSASARPGHQQCVLQRHILVTACN